MFHVGRALSLSIRYGIPNVRSCTATQLTQTQQSCSSRVVPKHSLLTAEETRASLFGGTLAMSVPQTNGTNRSRTEPVVWPQGTTGGTQMLNSESSQVFMPQNSTQVTQVSQFNFSHASCMKHPTHPKRRLTRRGSTARQGRIPADVSIGSHLFSCRPQPKISPGQFISSVF